MWLPTVVVGGAHRAAASGCATGGCSGCGTPCRGGRRSATRCCWRRRRWPASGWCPALLLGGDPTVVVTVAAAALAAVFAVRRRDVLRFAPGAVAARGVRARPGAAVETVLRHGGDRVVGGCDRRAAPARPTCSRSPAPVPSPATCSTTCRRTSCSSRMPSAAATTGCSRCCSAPTSGRWCCSGGRWRPCCGASAAGPAGSRCRPGSFAAFGLLVVPIVLVASTLALIATS